MNLFFNVSLSNAVLREEEQIVEVLTFVGSSRAPSPPTPSQIAYVDYVEIRWINKAESTEIDFVNPAAFKRFFALRVSYKKERLFNPLIIFNSAKVAVFFFWIVKGVYSLIKSFLRLSTIYFSLGSE